jgi:HlyD family secretion protein
MFPAMKRVWISAVSVLVLAACGSGAPESFQGYVEGEYVLVASPYGGTLERLGVARGQALLGGTPLFVLEHAAETDAVRQADAQLKAAAARLSNLAQARRKPEQAALQAQVDNADAALRLSVLQLEQQEKLAKEGFISATGLAAARAAHDRDVAQTENARAQLATARLSLGRDAELTAARADAEAARAALGQAKTKLAQKSPAAPAAALVQDTFFTVGEWVPPATPVVSLLPPGNVKIRFFVPETAIARIKPGQTMQASCDACPAPVAAKVIYVSTQTEYTPPVIYGRDSRAKLVYLVEAKPDAGGATRLTPGQPVDVRIAAP